MAEVATSVERNIVGEVSRFLLVGTLNAVVDFLVYLSLTRGFVWWDHHYLLANALAFWVANVNSFVWNRLWTFSIKHGQFWRQYLEFFSVSLIYLGFIQLGLWVLVSHWGWFDLLAKVVVIGLGMILYFTVLKKLVFRPIAKL